MRARRAPSGESGALRLCGATAYTEAMTAARDARHSAARVAMTHGGTLPCEGRTNTRDECMLTRAPSLNVRNDFAGVVMVSDLSILAKPSTMSLRFALTD